MSSPTSNDEDLQGCQMLHARAHNVTGESDIPTEHRGDGLLAYYPALGNKRAAFWDLELNKFSPIARMDRTADGPVNVRHPRFGAKGDGTRRSLP